MIMLFAALIAAEAASAAVPPVAKMAAPAAATGPATTVAGTAQRPTRAQVLAAVKAEWSQHDQGNKGKLTPLEFGTWVMKSHGGTVSDGPRTRGIKPISAMNASATAFARADANHDGGVTPDELASFLMQPPAPTALQREQAAAQARGAAARQSSATTVSGASGK